VLALSQEPARLPPLRSWCGGWRGSFAQPLVLGSEITRPSADLAEARSDALARMSSVDAEVVVGPSLVAQLPLGVGIGGPCDEFETSRLTRRLDG
jgi:hypothetical protein